MAGRWELNDEQWAVLEPVLRPERRADNRGRPWHDTRSVLNGVLWVLGTGAQWRELPEKYPPYQTCHRRFQQWIAIGLVIASATMRFMSSLLYGVGVGDPITYVTITCAVVIAALLACYLPSRRAAEIDPALALRSE
jgi:hypothetical protein